MTVRYLYTRFIQGLLYSAPRGTNYHWNPDPQISEVVITQESPIKQTTLNQRPVISITRAPIGFHHLGFDDQDGYDFRTGAKTKSILVPGTMVINCCSRVDLESEHLAWVIAEHLWLLRDLLLQKGFYDVGRNIQVGSPSSPGAIVEGDSADEWFCTSVTSPYQFSRTSRRTPLSTGIVRAIEVQLGIGKLRAIERGVALSVGAGSNPPFLVQEKAPAPYAPGAPTPVLPVAPHPLDPAKQVTVRRVRGGVITPRYPVPEPLGFLHLQGATLPITERAVEQCEPSQVVSTTKVNV